jgi:glycosyltransferase A (GT-A) superfamily protein (DUF2064 family)
MISEAEMADHTLQVHKHAANAVTLALFARLPVPGKAKTRLAAGVGPGPAARFYQACAENTFREALR